jgi:cell division initiation protein
MALTPVEIRHITVGRSLVGYSRAAVDKLLDDIVESFEDVWRDRADLKDKVEHLEQDLVRHRELETLLRTTLVSAERASQELKEQAKRESELVLSEAHAEARRITREAASELERLQGEVRRVRSLLAAALEAIGEAGNGDDEHAPTPEVRAA